MLLQNFIIIIIASLIGFGYLIIIRSFSIYEKESIGILIITAIFGGSIAIGILYFVYQFTIIDDNFIDAIVKIGPIKELSKLIAFILLYPYLKEYLNEIVDGIIYITAISLGFATFETILYMIDTQSSFSILIERSIFLVLGNLLFSGYMGIAVYIHFKVKQNFLGIMLALILAALTHGFFLGSLFALDLYSPIEYVLYSVFVLQFLFLKTIFSVSNFRGKFDVTKFHETHRTIFLNCCKCDNNIKSKEIAFWKIKAGICDSCNNIVFNSENILKLLKYYRPILDYQEYSYELSKLDRIISLDSNDKIKYNTKRHNMSADVIELGTWLEANNSIDTMRILDRPILGLLFKHLGLKYFA